MPSFTAAARFPKPYATDRQGQAIRHTAHNFYVEPDAPGPAQTSEFFATEERLGPVRSALRDLDNIKDDWNSYDAPAPSLRSINMGWRVLASLREASLIPERVLPSAEGGVAFIFISTGENRAVIETLNSGEDFVLLYDRRGNSKTMEWKGDITETLLRSLKTHLRGSGIAAP
jgi:hypothetical protein